jgi:hypothetical protein
MENTSIEVMAVCHAKRGTIVQHLCIDVERVVSERTAVAIAANRFAKFALGMRAAKATSKTSWSLTAMHTIRVEVNGISVFNSADINFSAVAGGDTKRAFTTSFVHTAESIHASIMSAYDLYQIICDSAE